MNAYYDLTWAWAEGEEGDYGCGDWSRATDSNMVALCDTCAQEGLDDGELEWCMVVTAACERCGVEAS